MPSPAAALDHLLLRLTWNDLDRTYLRRLVELARDEDLGGLGLAQKPARTGDRSTAALATTPRLGRAHLVARTGLVACGLPLLPLILSAYGPRASVQPLVQDGRPGRRYRRAGGGRAARHLRPTSHARRRATGHAG